MLNTMADARPEMDEGLRLAIEAVGGLRELARRLGVSPSALLQWRRIPSHRIKQVESVTKIPRRRLRPDLYD